MNEQLKAAVERLRSHVQWYRRNYKESAHDDPDGLQFTDDIDLLLAEHRADDDVPVTEEWLRSVGFIPRGDSHPERGPIMETSRRSGVMMAADGTFVHLIANYYAEMRHYTSIGNRKTRGDVRRLCSALGIPLKKGE